MKMKLIFLLLISKIAFAMLKPAVTTSSSTTTSSVTSGSTTTSSTTTVTSTTTTQVMGDYNTRVIDLTKYDKYNTWTTQRPASYSKSDFSGKMQVYKDIGATSGSLVSDSKVFSFTCYKGFKFVLRITEKKSARVVFSNTYYDKDCLPISPPLDGTYSYTIEIGHTKLYKIISQIPHFFRRLGVLHHYYYTHAQCYALENTLKTTYEKTVSEYNRLKEDDIKQRQLYDNLKVLVERTTVQRDQVIGQMEDLKGEKKQELQNILDELNKILARLDEEIKNYDTSIETYSNKMTEFNTYNRDTVKSLSNLKIEIETLSNEIGRLEGLITGITNSLSSKKTEKKNSEDKIKDLKEKIEQYKNLLTKEEANLKTVEGDITELTTQLKTNQDMMDSKIKSRTEKRSSKDKLTQEWKERSAQNVVDTNKYTAAVQGKSETNNKIRETKGTYSIIEQKSKNVEQYKNIQDKEKRIAELNLIITTKTTERDTQKGVWDIASQKFSKITIELTTIKSSYFSQKSLCSSQKSIRDSFKQNEVIPAKNAMLSIADVCGYYLNQAIEDINGNLKEDDSISRSKSTLDSFYECLPRNIEQYQKLRRMAMKR